MRHPEIGREFECFSQSVQRFVGFSGVRQKLSFERVSKWKKRIEFAGAFDLGECFRMSSGFTAANRRAVVNFAALLYAVSFLPLVKLRITKTIIQIIIAAQTKLIEVRNQIESISFSINSGVLPLSNSI